MQFDLFSASGFYFPPTNVYKNKFQVQIFKLEGAVSVGSRNYFLIM